MKREDVRGYEVFCGIDLGRESHSCCVMSADGETELARRDVAQDEAELAELFGSVSAMGRALVVLDQRGGFAALAVALARAAGLDVAWISPGRFSQVAELYGEEKTDARDAWVLALLPAEHPRLVEPVPDDEEEVLEAQALLRYRHDMVRERTRAYNRVHDALSRSCPPLERLLSGSGLHSRLALALLARYGASGLASSRRCDVLRWVRGQRGFGPAAEEEAGRIVDAAKSQAAALPAAGVLDQVVRADAARIEELERLDGELSEQVAQLCSGMPEVQVIRSMPGVGEVYSRTIALEVGDLSRFRSASALASYCGVGKCPRESGKGKGRKARRRYNRRLRTAVMESARIAIRRPGPDRDYYEKKLAGDMNGRQALHALARKRVSIMYAMLKNMEPYRAA